MKIKDCTRLAEVTELSFIREKGLSVEEVMYVMSLYVCVSKGSCKLTKLSGVVFFRLHRH